MAAKNIAGRKGGPVSITDGRTGKDVTIVLCSRSKGLLNAFFRSIKETRAQTVIGRAGNRTLGTGNKTTATDRMTVVVGERIVTIGIIWIMTKGGSNGWFRGWR